MNRKLPILVMEKLLKKAGIKRIGESAKTSLQDTLNARIQDITRQAAAFSKHAGRKTMTNEDITLSVRP